jgi:hypothetical protein
MNLSKGCSANRTLIPMINHFKRNKAQENNYRNNFTDKRNVLENIYKSNNIFEKFPLEGKTPQFRRKKMVLESEDNPENKNLISWQNFN